MAERRERSQLVGDGLRELSVLVIVFYTLDTVINRAFDWWSFAVVTAGALAVFYFGMILEGRDEL